VNAGVDDRGCGRFLGLLEWVVHVFIRRSTSSWSALHQAGKMRRLDHSAARLTDEKCDQELASRVRTAPWPARWLRVSVEVLTQFLRDVLLAQLAFRDHRRIRSSRGLVHPLVQQCAVQSHLASAVPPSTVEAWGSLLNQSKFPTIPQRVNSR
jgi:hypothetical protein